MSVLVAEANNGNQREHYVGSVALTLFLVGKRKLNARGDSLSLKATVELGWIYLCLSGYYLLMNLDVGNPLAHSMFESSKSTRLLEGQ